MFCKQCGCEIVNDSLFCENCGAKVENVPSAPQPAAPDKVPASFAAPVSDGYQAVTVTPVYPPNSVYARNATEAIRAQQVMMQQPQYVQAPQMQYTPAGQPYAAVTPLQQYPAPVYTQQLPGVLYDPNAAPAGSGIFLRILRIAGGVTSGIYTLLLLLTLVTDPSSDKTYAFLFALSYSLFVMIFSLCRKKIGKGAFIALIIPMAVILSLVTSLTGNN